MDTATSRECSYPEGAIKARMRLGDLLIQARLVTVEDVAKALDLQANSGGRLGDHLVASGAILQEKLNSFLHRIPVEPADMAATKIDSTDLLSLLMKVIYVDNLETVRQFIDAIKLPYNIVIDLIRLKRARAATEVFDRAYNEAQVLLAPDDPLRLQAEKQKRTMSILGRHAIKLSERRKRKLERGA